MLNDGRTRSCWAVSPPTIKMQDRPDQGEPRSGIVNRVRLQPVYVTRNIYTTYSRAGRVANKTTRGPRQARAQPKDTTYQAAQCRPGCSFTAPARRCG